MAKDKNQNQESEVIEEKVSSKVKNEVEAQILHDKSPISNITLCGKKLVGKEDKTGKVVFTLTLGQVTELKNHGYNIQEV